MSLYWTCINEHFVISCTRKSYCHYVPNQSEIIFVKLSVMNDDATQNEM